MKYPAKKIFRKNEKYEHRAPRNQNMVALETFNLRGCLDQPKLQRTISRMGDNRCTVPCQGISGQLEDSGAGRFRGSDAGMFDALVFCQGSV